MKRLSLSATALALSAVFAVSSVVPVEAMPVPQQQQVKQSSDVQNVKMIRRKHVRTNHRISRNHKTWRGHYARNSYRSWHGHRGYRTYRPGYRRYNGYWFPPAAFATGVVIGTTIRGGNAHVRWCRNRYVSYRVSDNTYQPYNGPRRECVSP
jgi:hypothetical protein